MKLAWWVLAALCIAAILIVRTFGNAVLDNPIVVAAVVAPFILFGLVHLLLMKREISARKGSGNLADNAVRVFYWMGAAAFALIAIAVLIQLYSYVQSA
ncbi:hypothetical protein [Montanilutibacter psychrotolerans]|uniref:Uncharacterized protein n=1 Tax=Montanilutibacter psychrotolerans TaxID=1327343 RepID=A0A3M8SRB6_9GAMM|nr:hypothetical protein [Lysobacter psychrotolerans]RNF83881.1 hypothetical protein EER27_11035 [Lysobacter psychrotolerans]